MSNRGSCRPEVKHTWLEVSKVKRPAGWSGVTRSKMTHEKLCGIHIGQDKEGAKTLNLPPPHSNPVHQLPCMVFLLLTKQKAYAEFVREIRLSNTKESAICLICCWFSPILRFSSPQQILTPVHFNLIHNPKGNTFFSQIPFNNTLV